MSISYGPKTPRIAEDRIGQARDHLATWYPAITDDQFTSLLDGNFIVVIADDDKPETVNTKAARVVVCKSRQQAMGIKWRYPEADVLSVYDFVLPDFLIGTYLNDSAGVSARLPYPITVNVDLEHQLELNMLVDTGAPTTFIMLPKDIFDQLKKAPFPEQVKGMETTNKAANCIVYINEEKVGKVLLVRSGGSFAGYLKGQFPGCSGILGMDLLAECNLSVCRGRVAIHFVPPSSRLQFFLPHKMLTN